MAKSALLFLFSFFLVQFAPAQSSLIKVKGRHFYRNDQPVYYIGTNYWYGGLLALKKDKKSGIDRLRKELDFLQRNGVTNVRVLGGS